MEGNRDDTERFIVIAVQALRDAKIDKAEKFLNKAEKLYPSQKAKGKSRDRDVFTIYCLIVTSFALDLVNRHD